MLLTPHISLLIRTASVLLASTTSPRGISAIAICPFALLVASVAIRRAVVAAGAFVVRHGRKTLLESLAQDIRQLVME